MVNFPDRRHDDRAIKELFEAKLDVLDARYKTIELQNGKLEGKFDRYLEVNDARFHDLETIFHGQGTQKGVLVRLDENSGLIKELRERIFDGRAGETGIIDDVKDLKAARQQRQHYWAVLGGLASGAAVWLLGKFGTTLYEYLTHHLRP